MKPAKYNVIDICEYIVNWFYGENELITHLKLQKILYFVQANFLVELGYPCFKEDILAWDLGPVVREAYNIYHIYGNAPLLTEKEESLKLPKEEKDCIEEILEQVKNSSAYGLVKLTHSHDPWKNTYNEGKGKDKVIKNEDILSFYKDKE